jgi:type I restriction enzyme, S subunit
MGTSWKTVDLGSVSLLITSGSRGWAEFYADEGATFLRITNLTRKSIRLDLRDLKQVKLPVGNTEGSRTRLQANDILVSITADLGIIGLAPDLGDAYVNQHIALIRPSHEVFPAFVAYYLSGPGQTQFARLNDAGAKAGLNLASIRKLSLVLPPLGEQRKIAAILSAVDDAIEATQAVIAQLQVVKRAMMAELLTRGLPGRHTRFKRTEIGEMPEEWDVRALREIAVLSSGGTPNRERAEFWNGGIPWVKTGEVNYNVVTHTEETISEYGLRNSAAKLLPPGTLLMAMYGQGGTRGRVAMLGIEAAVNQACLAIQPSYSVSVRYLFHVFSGQYDELRSLGHEGTQKNLNAKLIGDILVPIPSIEEQSAFIAVLDNVTERGERETAVLDSLRRVKAALMSVLLTGEVRVAPDKDVT